VRDNVRGLLPLFGALDANERAAQTLRALDPEGSLFPEAYLGGVELLARDDGLGGGALVPLAATAAMGGSTVALPGGDVRVPVDSRWGAMQVVVNSRDAVRRALEERRAAGTIVDETERTLKYAMFLLTLVYFRALSRLRKQRDLWSGERDAQFRAGLERKDGRSRERLRMEQIAAARVLREAALRRADEAANRGFARRSVRTTATRSKELVHKAQAAKLARERDAAALRIQAVWRGHRARVATYEWAVLRQRDLIQAKLRDNAAVAIQAVWRGYMARQIAHERRKELTAFVRMLRKEEERQLEEEYYAQNRLRRLQRDAAAFFRSRVAAVEVGRQRRERALQVPGDERDEEEDDLGATGAHIGVLRLGDDPGFWGLSAREYAKTAAKVGGKRANAKFKPGGYYQDVLERLLVKHREQDQRAKDAATAAAAAAAAAAVPAPPPKP
jgi:hypothetical protein